MKFNNLSVSYRGHDFSVSGIYSAGDPGVHTYANGDPGYPPTSPEVEYSKIEYKGVDIIKLLDEFFTNDCDDFYNGLDEKVIEQMEAPDDGDRAYDESVDEKLERGEK